MIGGIERTASPEQRLQWLVDRAEIAECLVNYARCIDRRDWAGLHDSYTADGVMRHGEVSVPRESVPELSEWMSPGGGMMQPLPLARLQLGCVAALSVSSWMDSYDVPRLVGWLWRNEPGKVSGVTMRVVAADAVHKWREPGCVELQLEKRAARARVPSTGGVGVTLRLAPRLRERVGVAQRQRQLVRTAVARQP